MRYIIKNNLERDKYFEFLKISFQISNFFSISTFKSVHKKDLKDSYFNFLNDVKPYMVTAENFVKLPQHYERGQKINIYHLNHVTKNSIQNAADSLYAWTLPTLPEDLSFFKNQKVWFNSITHAKIATIISCDECLIKQFDTFQLAQEP